MSHANALLRENYGDAVCRTAEIKILAKSRMVESGCREWTGYVMPTGYAQFAFGGKQQRAHRISYLLSKGSIPDGLIVLHSCDNRKCVNPDHLSLGTHEDNIQEAIARKRGHVGQILADRTHCKNGHEFNAENSRVIPHGRGKGFRRYCKVCQRECHQRMWRQKRTSMTDSLKEGT